MGAIGSVLEIRGKPKHFQAEQARLLRFNKKRRY